MKNFLRLNKPLIWLSVILFVFSTISIIIAFPFSSQEFFLSFGIELLLILITIWFIDSTLKKHEKMIWKGSRNIFANRAFRISNKVISIIAEVLDIESQVFLILDQCDPKDLSKYFSFQLVNNINNLEENLIFDRLFSLDQNSLVDLKLKLNQVSKEFISILINENVFSEPSEFELILGYREAIEKTISDTEMLIPFVKQIETQVDNTEDRSSIYRKIFIFHLGCQIVCLLNESVQMNKKFFIPESLTSESTEMINQKYKAYQIFKRNL